MKKKIFFILKIVFLLLIIISLIGLISWRLDKRTVEKIQETSKELIIETKNEEGEVSYEVKEEAVQKNEDTIGWLKVEGTNIDYPVVQTSDNKYYLNHNYLKKKSSAGWVFMDSENKLDDQNIVIYGHHRKDSIMFGHIDKLMKQSFYDKHPGKIRFIVGKENRVYQIFSAYEINDEDLYTNRNFIDLASTIHLFKERSVINVSKEFNNVDQIITLSTCHDNNKDRLVVQAYRIK